MEFLRRRLRGGTTSPDAAPVRAARDVVADPADRVDPDVLERDYELDLLRGEQDRLDALQQRQLRYANYAWEPPAQGGERRADDQDRSAKR
jgi:hypothetical protein